MENYTLEIIEKGSLEEHDRTTLRMEIGYLENGIEFSTTLYVSRWEYNDVDMKGEPSLLRDFLLNALKSQLKHFQIHTQADKLNFIKEIVIDVEEGNMDFDNGCFEIQMWLTSLKGK
tara:strand:+ start:3537 stop:3887 length:351 start_codon:yes stop_codon:yes gene_type:complete